MAKSLKDCLGVMIINVDLEDISFDIDGQKLFSNII